MARPTSRNDFRIAIVCALPCEYNAVSLLIDEFWDEDGDPYRRAEGDPNIYVTGRIGETNVVLVRLPEMGKGSAAGAAASLRSSFPRLEAAFLTGICGGVPRSGSEEILLGDVILSKTVVQYDLGRQYPGEFVTKDTVEASLGRPAKHIRTLVAAYETDLLRGRLEKRTSALLEKLQHMAAERSLSKYQYPGVEHDKLFPADYPHKHQAPAQCSICANPNMTCEQSKQLSCDSLECDSTNLIERKRLQRARKNEEHSTPLAPAIFVGRIGSGDTVMKSGEDRDRIAAMHSLLAFEMEGAGIWDEIPCITVKAVCDYTDSHKNKRWQDYAAATAPSAMKALLEHYPKTDNQGM